MVVDDQVMDEMMQEEDEEGGIGWRAGDWRLMDEVVSVMMVARVEMLMEVIVVMKAVVVMEMVVS